MADVDRRMPLIAEVSKSQESSKQKSSNSSNNRSQRHQAAIDNQGWIDLPVRQPRAQSVSASNLILEHNPHDEIDEDHEIKFETNSVPLIGNA